MKIELTEQQIELIKDLLVHHRADSSTAMTDKFIADAIINKLSEE
jgi:hypothetical protein